MKFKKFYKFKHKAKNLIKKSIYSLSELKKEQLKHYRVIANPGCYPTSSSASSSTIIKEKTYKYKNITIDSKSGYSGAGKNYRSKFNFKNFYMSQLMLMQSRTIGM